MYTFLLCIFYNFYYMYLEILKIKIYIENCEKVNEKKKTEEVLNKL